MRIRACLCGLVLLGALPRANAQEVPSLEVSGGYSLLRVRRGLGADLADTEQTLHGWYAEAAATQTAVLSLVGQAAGSYGTFRRVNVKAHEFAAGARLNRRMGGRVMFGQALIGVVHHRPYGTERATNATFHAGGGLRLGAADTVGVLVGADYEIIFTGGSHLLEPEGGSRTHGLRLTAGAAFPIGG
jgi:hypothetical protein